MECHLQSGISACIDDILISGWQKLREAGNVAFGTWGELSLKLMKSDLEKRVIVIDQLRKKIGKALFPKRGDVKELKILRDEAKELSGEIKVLDAWLDSHSVVLNKMGRSQLGDYVHDALVSAKKHLESGDLEAVNKDKQKLKSNLESLGETGLHLTALDWGSWKELNDLQDYELVHDSNRPAGDPREYWICTDMNYR